MLKKALILTTLVLAGCASSVPPGWGAVGGSRADGTVVVGYDRSELEKENTDREAATAVARRRCRAWGYSDADAFDQTTRTCVGGQGFFTNCATWRHRLEFQCTHANENRNGRGQGGNPNASNNNWGMELQPN